MFYTHTHTETAINVTGQSALLIRLAKEKLAKENERMSLRTFVDTHLLLDANIAPPDACYKQHNKQISFGLVVCVCLHES